MDDDALTIPEVARRLRTSTKTVYRRIHAGELVATDLGTGKPSKHPHRGKHTMLRVRESAIEKYLAANTVKGLRRVA